MIVEVDTSPHAEEQASSGYPHIFQQESHSLDEHQSRALLRKVLSGAMVGSPSDTSGSTWLGVLNPFEKKTKCVAW